MASRGSRSDRQGEDEGHCRIDSDKTPDPPRREALLGYDSSIVLCSEHLPLCCVESAIVFHFPFSVLSFLFSPKDHLSKRQGAAAFQRLGT